MLSAQISHFFPKNCFFLQLLVNFCKDMSIFLLRLVIFWHLLLLGIFCKKLDVLALIGYFLARTGFFLPRISFGITWILLQSFVIFGKELVTVWHYCDFLSIIEYFLPRIMYFGNNWLFLARMGYFWARIGNFWA